MSKNENVKANSKYKDSVFRLLFSKDKESALSLYNAVNNSNYTNPDDLEYKNLEDAFYVNVKNDTAFIFAHSLNLYEHQSTICPNMPLRGLFYMSTIYRKLVKKKDLYSEKLIKIPTPKFVVFYNGSKEMENGEMKLRLSDMFETPDDSGEFEWTATVFDINYDENRKNDILDNCETLKGYAILIEKIRRYRETMDVIGAIEKAIDECIAEDILSDFLVKERQAVIDMSILSLDRETYEEIVRESAYEDGFERGKEAGMKAGREAGLKAGREAGLKAGRENAINEMKELLNSGESLEEIIKTLEETK